MWRPKSGKAIADSILRQLDAKSETSRSQSRDHQCNRDLRRVKGCIDCIQDAVVMP